MIHLLTIDWNNILEAGVGALIGSLGTILVALLVFKKGVEETFNNHIQQIENQNKTHEKNLAHATKSQQSAAKSDLNNQNKMFIETEIYNIYKGIISIQDSALDFDVSSKMKVDYSMYLVNSKYSRFITSLQLISKLDNDKSIILKYLSDSRYPDKIKDLTAQVRYYTTDNYAAVYRQLIETDHIIHQVINDFVSDYSKRINEKTSDWQKWN